MNNNNNTNTASPYVLHNGMKYKLDKEIKENISYHNKYEIHMDIFPDIEAILFQKFFKNRRNSIFNFRTRR